MSPSSLFIWRALCRLDIGLMVTDEWQMLLAETYGVVSDVSPVVHVDILCLVDV